MSDETTCHHARLRHACTLTSRAALSSPARQRCGTAPRCRRGRAQRRRATLIDTHHHFYPPAYQKAFNDWEDAQQAARTRRQQADWTRDKAVEAMDKNGIRTGMLSLPSTAGLWFDAGPEAAASMVRICNDFGAQMVRDFPGRFGLFAPLSMLDIDTTLKEIEYAFDTLKADGVGLQIELRRQVAGRRRSTSRCSRNSTAARRSSMSIRWWRAAAQISASAHSRPCIEVPHDTTRTVTSLLLSGTFARHARHPLAVLARRRHHADDGGPHQCVLRQQPEAPRSSRRTES